MRAAWLFGFRTRLLLLVLLALIPLLGLTAYSAYERRQAAVTDAEEEASRLVQRIDAAQRRVIDAGHALLFGLAQTSAVQRLEPAACSALLAEARRQFPVNENIGVVRPDGTLRCTAVGGAQPINYADRDWFQRAMATRAFVVDRYVIGRVVRRPVLALAQPVRDDAGGARAVLFTGLGTAWLAELVAETRLTPGTDVLLLDGAGTVLARFPGDDSWVGRRLAETPLFRSISGRRDAGTAHVPGPDGTPRFFAFKRLGGIQGEPTAAVGIAESVVFAEANRLLRVNLLGLALVLAVTLAAGVVTGRIFVLRPIDALVRAIRRLQAGEPDVRVELPGVRGELGELVRGFNEMSVALEARGAALERARDDLERRVAERTEELERASRAKSEFLSRMSHELRTPLNAVLGFAQLLDESRLTPEDRESAEQIVKAGRHLLGTINEILDIARIEAGRMTLSLEPVEAGEAVRAALALVQSLAAPRGIELSADLGAAGDRHVLADRQRLQQVLLNLLSNAIKYNRDGGRVTVTAAAREGRLRLAVADTGPGIAPERLDRLFVAFERPGTEALGVEGTGLGLVLARGLVEAMGGKFGVESVEGQGSTFWLELGEAASPEAAPALVGESPAAAEETAPNGTLLYIEDNLSNLKLVERIVARRPAVKLVSAMQGRLGLDLAREHQPRLILLDVHLPDLPGSQVLARLRAEPRTRDIPVVILSADATPGQIKRLLAEGARAYLTKPLDVRQVLAVLDEHLGSPRG